MEKNVCRFDENFIRNYDEDRNKGYILEVDVKYQKNWLICIVIYRS